MRRYAILLVVVAASLAAAPARGQRTLGELLDAGAKRLTVEEFRAEVVQRLVVGPTPTGGNMELLYTVGGIVQGRGGAGPATSPLVDPANISGEWKADEGGRICTSLRIGWTPGAAISSVILPPKCQFWFRHERQYYLSDTDWDRSGKVLVRTLKP